MNQKSSVVQFLKSVPKALTSDNSFGAFEVDGQSVWWKIDLYDKSYLMGSVMPADTDKTRRVLTIMFPSDY
ncbi:DUF3768 domain-containing protein [Amylibacter sp. IMCC11727]|uniref:DUF3768 domain-containing protein n=1 Tax=Amylibacter sp. IMCC11727 TaxID=3039851 RepID=UPI00244DFF3E|nr:DUF3768 domain-containing protein [Amylibacter sp. IMCC11727]WGI21809.1 DUF3768 domain-containing protein [Amylibacter sp. IMCC11727]